MARQAFPDTQIVCIDGASGEMESVRDQCSHFVDGSDFNHGVQILQQIWESREKDVLPIEMRPVRYFVFVHQISRLPLDDESQMNHLLRLINNNNGRAAGVVLLASGLRAELARDSKEHQTIYKLLIWHDGIVVSGMPKQYRDDLEFQFDYSSPDFGKLLSPDTGIRYQKDTRATKFKLIRER